jgi:hypothetical protein
MRERIVERSGSWHIATAIGASGRFVSWAKMGPITGDGPLTEPGYHVWFNFGATRDDAVKAIKQELGIA